MQNAQVKTDKSAEPVVYVIDDDAEIRSALVDLFTVTNKRASAFPNGLEFLKWADVNAPGCVVVDMRMPGGRASTFKASFWRSAASCRSFSSQPTRMFQRASGR